VIGMKKYRGMKIIWMNCITPRPAAAAASQRRLGLFAMTTLPSTTAT